MIIPFAGVNFGGDSGKALEDAFDASRFNWGVSFAYMGGGVLGLEADFGYTPISSARPTSAGAAS